MKEQYIYGVDFGTTNSALAILDLRTNEVVKVFTMPSILFFPAFQSSRKTFDYSVGTEAIEKYIANKMEGRFMKSIKAVLPNKSFTKTKIANRYFNAADLVALIVSGLKKQADDYLGFEINTAIIWRPVVFSESVEKETAAQERLERAIEKAGFKDFFFQLEPIAAAYTYERQIKSKELVLVADFGGGTSDFTLMNLDPSSIDHLERKSDIIAKGGIYIGGDNFDSKLMWHKGTPHFGRGLQEQYGEKWLDLPSTYYTNISSWQKMNFLNSTKMQKSIRRSYVFSGRNERVMNLLILIEKNLGYSLFQEIEKTKIKLTQSNTATLSFNKENIQFEEPVGINEFSSKIIIQETTKIENYLNQFLLENNISPKKIDTVFMTGGTSMVRPLQNIFIEKFGKEKIKSGDNFNSVAMGLAYSYRLFG